MKTIIKILNSIDAVRNEIKFLSKNKINVFTGYYSRNQIIVNVTSNTGSNSSILYQFKNKHHYNEVKHYLKKREMFNI